MRFDLTSVPLSTIERLLVDIWVHAIEQDKLIAKLQGAQMIHLEVAPKVEEAAVDRLTKRLVTTEREINALRVRLSKNTNSGKEVRGESPEHASSGR